MPPQEIYVSTDVEADGPIPGVYSMLSFASAAYTIDKELVGTFEANLLPLDGAIQHESTMKWFREKEPEALAAATRNQESPHVVLPRYLEWLKALPGKPVFVGYPASYDFMFVYWYLIKFAGESPFSHSALDIKTYAMAMLKTDYRQSIKATTFPKRWFDKSLPHTHQALDDAKEQGIVFINMLRENLELV